MNIKDIFVFLSLFIFSSCSIFINKIDDDILNKNATSYKKNNKIKTYCKKVSSLSVVSENNRNQKIFKSFLSENVSKKFTYADKAVLWSLAQMNIRPDLSSPTSKLQFFIKVNNISHFFHVYSKNKKQAYPYLHALNLILKKFKGNYNLLNLAKIIDDEYPSQYYVTANFSKFLSQNKNLINQNSTLKHFYIRGDETLKRNERIKKWPLSNMVKDYKRTKKKVEYAVSNYLFSYKRNNLINAQCNYDMGLYSSSIYLIHKDVIHSNTFGLRQGNNMFMADSTQALNTIFPLNHSIYFKGQSQSRSPAMCQFSLPLNKKWNLWLISSQSRDPGQHLFHLIEYGLEDITKLSQLDNLLRFSRHLFLKNPIRLILESERSNHSQLNELLKLNMPIYNSEKLARIWGQFSYKKNKSFIIDQRRTGNLTCH